MLVFHSCVAGTQSCLLFREGMVLVKNAEEDARTLSFHRSEKRRIVLE